MKALQFALRLLRRDWRSGEIRLLSLALIIAAASVTAVSFFTNRVERAIELQAAEMLAADLVVTSSRPTPDSLYEQAERLGLSSANTLSFPSVVVTGERTQLVNVKAISGNYPLRGELRTRPRLGAPEEVAQQIPASGSVWTESRLLGNLQLSVGETLHLGEKSFDITRVLSRDSGGSGNLFRLGARVLLNIDDIPATGLVTPASRVRYSLLLAGPPAALEKFKRWVRANHPTGFRFEDISNARPELRTALDRGSSFLALAALAAVLIAGAAVALATHRFVDKQSDVSAVMRCLGASRRFIFQVLLIRLLIIALLASTVGSVLGFIAQFLLVELIGDWFTSDLPAPDLYPLFIGLGTGLITLLGFTLTPMLRLSAVPPLRVLRRELGAPPTTFWILGAGAFTALALLMFWQAGDVTLAGMVLGGTLTAVSLMLLVSHGLVQSLTPLRQHAGSTWRYGLAGLARNPTMTAVQLTGFGIGMLALLLLAIVRVDLLNAWEQTIPEETPNHFLINIQPQEVEALGNYLAEQGLNNGGLYPMLRARLTQINGNGISPDDYSDPRSRRLVNREFNLSWAAEMQNHNALLQGEWWSEEQRQAQLFSVEEGIAQTLGI
ncbi:MAG: FtsX-like permease family protein, partial [Chromatiales bacterium]|nr:FtsX-like permease family protein [Chromatiales bacterium]